MYRRACVCVHASVCVCIEIIILIWLIMIESSEGTRTITERKQESWTISSPFSSGCATIYSKIEQNTVTKNFLKKEHSMKK